MTRTGGRADIPSGRDQWLGVELRHLAALAAVGRERSFRGAAESLGYVQSAVSQQIAFLERLVGVRLVERARGPKPVALTDAGALLVGHVEDILARLGAAQADLEALVDGESRTARIGGYESVSTRIVPAVLSRLRATFPHLDVSTRESDTDRELFDLVASGELDAAFADLPLERGPFQAEPLLRDRYVLLVCADSSLACKRDACVADLAGLPLIGHVASRSMPRVEAELRRQGIEPNVVFRSDIVTTVQALVAQGIGAAILPRLAIDPSNARTCTVELGDALAPRVIALFWDRERADGWLLEALRAAARRVALELQQTPALRVVPADAAGP